MPSRAIRLHPSISPRIEPPSTVPSKTVLHAHTCIRSCLPPNRHDHVTRLSLLPATDPAAPRGGDGKAVSSFRDRQRCSYQRGQGSGTGRERQEPPVV